MERQIEWKDRWKDRQNQNGNIDRLERYRENEEAYRENESERGKMKEKRSENEKNVQKS